jgi:hypothetical protein
MSVTQTFVRDQPKSWRSHWIVPFGVLLVLMAMTLVPGMLAEAEADNHSPPPGALVQLPLAK